MGTPCLSGLGWVLGVGLVLLPLLPLGWEEGEDAHGGLLPLHNFGVSELVWLEGTPRVGL